MKHLILPFDWNVSKVWRLPAPTESIKIQKLMFLLTNPFWSSSGHSYTDFDLTPLAVINGTHLSQRHTDRIQNANTHRSLDFIETEGRLWILDGIHRLAKIYTAGGEGISIRKHTLKVRSLIEVQPIR